jgi:hypothetical protein
MEDDGWPPDDDDDFGSLRTCSVLLEVMLEQPEAPFHLSNHH